MEMDEESTTITGTRPSTSNGYDNMNAITTAISPGIVKR